MKTSTILLNIFAPPVAILMRRGIGNDFAINLLCCLAFYIPGVLHAFYITAQRNQAY
ncbi:MAG: YqaE/Pmp3 family membrane protein [Nonlabens sp.]|uniref:YqaE/Pmp3 family membrane protein n=1 Tax=Nonlabens sp. TaxID=1888209 RepID=UPI003EF1CE04